MFNTLKKTSLAILVVSTSLFQISCDKDDTEPDKLGNWYRQGIPDFEGLPRNGAVSFVIGDKGYIGTGNSNEVPTLAYKKDMWSFTGKTWSQTADFPGTGRSNATSFVVNNKAYVGTGFDNNSLAADYGYKKDFYEYDPATNKWKQIADFPTTRRHASSFALGTKGYVGLGSVDNSTLFQDFFSYDPATNKWDVVATFTGGKRHGANAFVLGGKAYVGFGQSNSTNSTKDLYSFDPAANSWTRLEASNDNLTARAFGFTLVLNDKAYIIGGTGSSDVWQYEAGTNTWTAMTNFEGGARSSAAGFTLGNVGYFGTGLAGSTRVDDFWAFDPAATVNADDN
ncbi:kelch repeat-containing protein [Dyadobacter sp. CY312]|uniref:Kelch repeat-containing protein n=1 Tax=Dyadobacter sp. CY312 TaxID=2907303 RepID=UPI001F2557D3|nr:kelch repeat-containing protein [Dyadobacter sp. CY312]MCE7041433.1 galactose oxidase [Dyadobacter sp. CY312]